MLVHGESNLSYDSVYLSLFQQKSVANSKIYIYFPQTNHTERLNSQILLFPMFNQ